MDGVIVYIDYGGKMKKILMQRKEYECTFFRAYYGIIVIEDIGKAIAGTVIGTYGSDTLTITYADDKLVLNTDSTRLETGVKLIGLNPKLNKIGQPVVEVIKPYPLNA